VHRRRAKASMADLQRAGCACARAHGMAAADRAQNQNLGAANRADSVSRRPGLGVDGFRMRPWRRGTPDTSLCFVWPGAPRLLGRTRPPPASPCACSTSTAPALRVLCIHSATTLWFSGSIQTPKQIVVVFLCSRYRKMPRLPILNDADI
jgi:hypothetical protein